MTIVRTEVSDIFYHVIAAGLPPVAGTPEATPPVPLYGVDTAALLTGEGLAALFRFGWRTLVIDPTGVRIADLAEADGAPSLTATARGAVAERLFEAGKIAEAEAADAEFELRMVESSELKIGALWLTGPRHCFIPYAGLQMETVDQGEFLAVLLARARQRQDALARVRANPPPAAPPAPEAEETTVQKGRGQS